MKVKELLEKLSGLDPEAEATIRVDQGLAPVGAATTFEALARRVRDFGEREFVESPSGTEKVVIIR